MKYTISLALIALASGLMAGCGNSSSATPPATAGTATGGPAAPVAERPDNKKVSATSVPPPSLPPGAQPK